MNVLVIDAIRYTLSPDTHCVPTRDSFRSIAVWCEDHSVSFEEVISTEYEEAAKLSSDTTCFRDFSIEVRAC